LRVFKHNHRRCQLGGAKGQLVANLLMAIEQCRQPLAIDGAKRVEMGEASVDLLLQQGNTVGGLFQLLSL
jgi:hypothetical protein